MFQMIVIAIASSSLIDESKSKIQWWKHEIFVTYESMANGFVGT
jgi:hypothetical protein